MKTSPKYYPITFFILVFFCISSCSGPRTERVYEPGKDYSDSTEISSEREIKIILYSTYNEWKNTRYKKGGLSKDGVDCSGLVYEVFRTSFAQTLPRSALEQIKVGEPISKNSLRAGDLVFFKTGKNGSLHVGIYIENKTFLHVSEKRGVILSSLDNDYWEKTYFQAKRIRDFLIPHV